MSSIAAIGQGRQRGYLGRDHFRQGLWPGWTARSSDACNPVAVTGSRTTILYSGDRRILINRQRLGGVAGLVIR